MAPNTKTHLVLTHFLLFFLSILTIPSLLLSDSIPTVYEILPQFGLPSGLLPDSVVNYTSSDDGRFVVFLANPCYVQFEYLVYYDKTITGKLSNGSITGLKGIQVQRFFLWLDVDEIRVDLPPSDSIYFQVGLINKTLDLGQFKTVHSCRDKVTGTCAKRIFEITRECGFFELVNHKLCEHDKRVADHLRKWHESLMAEARQCETIVEVEVGKVKVEMEKEVDKVKAEARRCETIVEVEVGKVKVEMGKKADKVKEKIEKQVGKTKAEMDNEIAQYRKEIEIREIKFQVMNMNYLTMLVGSWILFAFYVFFFRYTSKNQHGRRIGRMTLS